MKRDVMTIMDVVHLAYEFKDEEGIFHHCMLINDDTQIRIIKDHPTIINFVTAGKWYEDHILDILNDDPAVQAFIYNPGKNGISVYLKEV